MKNKFLYIFALLLILSACKKEGNSYVKGTITETGSNAPMEGVEVTLFKNTNSKSDILVKSVKTDAMGKYILPIVKNLELIIRLNVRIKTILQKRI